MKKLFDRVDKFVNHASANTNSLVGKVCRSPNLGSLRMRMPAMLPSHCHEA